MHWHNPKEKIKLIALEDYTLVWKHPNSVIHVESGRA